MACYLVIDQKTNTVANVIEWDGVAAIPHLDAFLLVQGVGSPGWAWDGTTAIDPNPVPAVVTPPSTTVTVTE